MIDIDLRKMTPQQVSDAMKIKRMGVMSDADLQKLIDKEIGKQSEKITNADRIRSMTDEQLADAMLKIDDIADHVPFCGDLPECEEIMDKCKLIPDGLCKQCLMEWLEKEVSN